MKKVLLFTMFIFLLSVAPGYGAPEMIKLKKTSQAKETAKLQSGVNDLQNIDLSKIKDPAARKALQDIIEHITQNQ